MHTLRLGLATTVLLCSYLPAKADMMTIGAQKDATIFQNNADNSNGAGPGLFVGTNGSNSPRRTLIEFNVAGSLPAGATITGVSFTLVLGQVAGSGGGSGGGTASNPTIGLFDLARDWGEGTTGSTATSIGGTGQGYAANTGDATWNDSRHGASPWTTVGGDHATGASATLTLVGSTVGTAFTWSSPGLVGDVQNWETNPASNDGWELINANESAATSFYSFYSREWGAGSTASTGNVSQEPMLQITYSVPEPRAAGLLIGVPLLCFAAARIRKMRALA